MSDKVGPGRKPLRSDASVKVTSISLWPDLLDRIAARAKAEGKSVSEWVRAACEAAMAAKPE